MECTKDSNKKSCTCTYTSCPRHGICCQCIEYHRSKGQMVGCYFTKEGESTYDRSMKYFVSQLD